MRILVVCTDAEIGGAERFLASLARARRPEDIVALTVLMKPGSLSDQLESAFDEVHYLGFDASSRNLLGMVRALEQVARKFTPDVVSSHLFHADIVVALARIDAPKTTTVHTQSLGPDDHPLTRLIARAIGFLSFRFAAVVPASGSPQMAAFIRSLRMRNVVAAIPNGARVPPTPAFQPGSRQFLSLARNHPVKGHRALFEAFSIIAGKIPEWTLLAHGPDVIEENEAMLTALNDSGAISLSTEGRIQLRGATAQPEVPLASSAALVISSVYGEAFPIVGAEAAGLGIPVITTDLGSCAEFADDPQFVVPPGNIEALASAMLTYAQLSDEERSRLSAMARSRAEERYHPEVAYERYREVFRRVATGRKGRQE